jgi:dTDP-4-amino-4,6-dideoxygalactose transaminase
MHRINVTKSFLPPFEEYMAYVHRIWDNGQLTNQGPLLQELEEKVKAYLDVDDFHFVTNGTVALQLALNALGITEGEVITTPFSYVATTSAILWERCKPVFVDIEPNTFCIDASKIEAAITEKTKAIMAVHVFGFPCDIEKIQEIADRHNLKVIYDAAHAFGVEYKGKSLLDYGDISTCSFHATKLFHTIEGGGLVVRDEEISKKLELTKRFGHDGDTHLMLGINAKASELQAAMGLCNLEYVDLIIEQRKALVSLYEQLLAGAVQTPKLRAGTKHNYAYFPVVFADEKELFNVVGKMEKANVYPRRYFYPSLNTLPYIADTQICPVSEDISRRILCLPLYAGLEAAEVSRICELVRV